MYSKDHETASIGNSIRLFMIFVICLFSLASLAQNAAAIIPIQKYDDFSNSTISTNLWIQDAQGAGTVSFSGGQATLDMTSPTTGKAARIAYPTSFTKQAINQQLRVTWDQQILVDGISGFDSGFALVSGGTMLFDAGQIGRENDGVVGEPFLPHHFIINFATTVGTFGSIDGGTAKHHFDLSVVGADISMSIYQYNSLFDSSPESYVSAGNLLETINQTLPSIGDTTPIQAVFFNELATGTDSHTIQNQRASVSIDNVFLNIPEPTSLCVFGLFAYIGLFRFRRSLPSAIHNENTTMSE